MNKTKTHVNDNYTWYVVDANNQTLGRLSTQISTILLGKNNPNYSPEQQSMNGVIVVNAEKIKVTGKKETDKFYKRHSGRPGGLTIETLEEVRNRIPTRLIEHSVKGMLPKGALGRSLFTKLKVYKGDHHPHGAQNPSKLAVN
jgi:large subunit ribosomal protein L13